MVDLSETTENILTWIGIALALLGAILALAGIGPLLQNAESRAIMTWFIGLIWILITSLNPTMLVLGAILALAGGALLLVVKILKMTGGGV